MIEIHYDRRWTVKASGASTHYGPAAGVNINFGSS
jgi:hypothetical protein